MCKKDAEKRGYGKSLAPPLFETETMGWRCLFTTA